MSWLVLDAMNMRIGLAEAYGQELAWQTVSRDQGSWQDIATAMLGKQAKTLRDVASVTVIQGKASFSDTRFVSLLANMASWLNPAVELFDLAVDSADHVPDTAETIAMRGKNVAAVKPAYYAEPNITKPKGK